MKPLGQRIRAFLEQLLTSRHVRFLESELIRVRMEKDAHIRTLTEEKAGLLAKIDKLELAIWPLSSRAGAVYAAPVKTLEQPQFKMPSANTYAEALREHTEKLEHEEKPDA
jgi:flagellar biosynthesis/type III secretory pathway chaperone